MITIMKDTIISKVVNDTMLYITQDKLLERTSKNLTDKMPEKYKEMSK
jgi:hypothetical protein